MLLAALGIPRAVPTAPAATLAALALGRRGGVFRGNLARATTILAAGGLAGTCSLLAVAPTARAGRGATRGDAIGFIEAIAHVHTIFAIELEQCELDLGRLDLLHDVARHAVGAAVAALLGSALLAIVRAAHIREVHAEHLAALQTQHQLLTRGVVLHDARLAKRGVDERLLLWCTALEVFVRLELVAQAAHQAPAHARDLGGVERQVLLLGHADGHRLELATKARAAQLLAAGGVAADQPRLVAHADLAHVHAHVETVGEVAHELAEVHALLSGKVEDGLLAAKEELHPHGLHLQAVLLDQAAEIAHGVLALARQLVGAVEVGVVGDADHGFEGGGQAGRGNLEGILGHQPDLGAALGVHHGVVRLRDVEALGVEPQVLGGIGKLDGDNYRHRSAFLISSSMTSRAS